MKALLKKHLRGALNETLQDVRLARKPNPQYDWTGVLKHCGGRRISLELTTAGKLRSLFLNTIAGAIIPDDGYFSLSARARGFRFHVERLFPADYQEYPFAGVDVKFQPHEIRLEGDSLRRA